MSINAIVMTIMLVVALGVFAYLMAPRMRLLTVVQPENRFDRIPDRIISVLKFAIGQWRMPRELIAGVAHIFIFSGFMIVSLATVQHIVHAYVPGWHLLPGILNKLYTLVKDLVEVLVLVGVSYALWRRLSPKESRVGRSWEGVFILLMITTLMVTDFLSYGGWMAAAGQDEFVWWNPVGWSFGRLVAGNPETAQLVGDAAWWIHCATVLTFLNFLPIGKHFHVITGIPDVFFLNLRPYGAVPLMDFEDESVESYGMGSVKDMNWKMVLDTYSCTECGRCNVYCPTMLTGKPLSHRQLNKDLKAELYEHQDALLSGDEEKLKAIPNLVGNRISEDTIWACTTCGACEQECPVFIEQTPRIIQMRQYKVLTESDISPELGRAFKGMENNSNPWGVGYERRDEWAEGLDVQRLGELELKEGEEPPLLYWIGCAGSFDDRNKKITLAMVKILKAAGVPFVILGKEEGCTGDPARRTGNEYLYQALANANVETLNGYNVKKILANCPHCLHTIKTEYPQLGGEYDVVHHSELIDQLIKDGKLDLTEEVNESVTYHDSCYIGRYHGIYDAPRNVIKAVKGTTYKEMPRNKSRSVCCGAGGGRFWMEEHIGERINVHRATEAVGMQTDTVANACPFCLIMMRDGINHIEKEQSAKDIAEIVAEALG